MVRDSVVIIGSGLMGSGIAAVCALSGNKAVLVDTRMEKACEGFHHALENAGELCNNGLAPTDAIKLAESNISYTDNLRAALDSAALVIEAVYENLELKQSIFKEIDGILPPEIPLASNTSGLRITDIARDTKHPERTMTTHFWFPAHLVPLVEIVMSERTDEDIAKHVKKTISAWGKSPVLVKKDLPGQLANRILQAVIREAVNIVAMDLASAEDVDTAVKMGMGIRFPAWGPLEHIDAVGLDLAVSVQNTVLPGISAEKTANEYLERLVQDKQLGYKSGKGIYDWSVKDMDQLAAKRNSFIIQALKFLESNE